MRPGLVRSITSNYAGFAVRSLIMLLLTPFLIGRLGDAQYGAWILLNTILAYFQLAELGVPAAIIRYVSRHRARGEAREVDEIVGSAIAFLIAVSAAAVPVVWAVATYGPGLFGLEAGLAEMFGPAAWLVGLAAVLAYFKRALYALIEGHQRFDLLNLCSTSGAVLGALATVVFVLQGAGLPTLVAILAIQTLFETLVELVVAMRVFGVVPDPRRATREALRRLLGFSYYAFLIDVAVSIAHRIDTLVIGVFLPIEAITFYTIGTRIAGVLEKLTEPLIDTFFPLASDLEASSRDETLRRLLLEGTRTTTLMAVPGLILVAVHGGKIIEWWIGADYVARSLPVLHVFLGVIFFAVFESTSSRILLGTGRVRFDANVSLATAAANLALSLFLVGRFGILGVALGTLIPIAVVNTLVSVPYTCRVTGTATPRFYARVLGPALVVSGALGAFFASTAAIVSGPVLRVALDSIAVAAVTGIVFLRFLRGRDSEEHDAGTVPRR